jgi:hypothetical protein
MALIGKKSEVWAFSDDVTEFAEGVSGFIADVDGYFEGKLRDDATARTITVKGGVLYPLDLLAALQSGKSGVTELLLIRGKGR